MLWKICRNYSVSEGTKPQSPSLYRCKWWTVLTNASSVYDALPCLLFFSIPLFPLLSLSSLTPSLLLPSSFLLTYWQKVALSLSKGYASVQLGEEEWCLAPAHLCFPPSSSLFQASKSIGERHTHTQTHTCTYKCLREHWCLTNFIILAGWS